MQMTDLPPAFVLFAAAALLAFVRGKARWVIALAAPLIALADAWAIIDIGASTVVPFMGYQINPVHVHAATPVFATIFCIMLGGGMLFALNQKRQVELPAAFVYAGGALGVCFAGDLISMFIFWEIMTLGSTVIIFSGRQENSEKSGLRYFGLHAVGGVLLLIGIVIVINQRMYAGEADPLAFRHFHEMISGWTSFSWETLGLWMVLLGMLVNVGAPPFSAWIGDSYPEGSESGSVFLSAFTTKTAVFTLMVGFAGTELLIYLGLWMALYGIVYAILENDMRRILAYSIVNQVGFMLVGIGVGTELAIDGASAHAFAHIIYKALLLMSAGSVLYATGKRKCTELGGLYRTMPVTMWCGIIGALAISSFPLTSGFTTKSMIVAAVSEQGAVMADLGQTHNHLIIAWFLLEAASAGVFLHAGIKFPWFVFFQKDSGLRPPEVPWNMRTAMIIFAAFCVLLGIFPGPLYEILPYKGVAAKFGLTVYSFEHVMQMLGLLLFSGLSFFVLLPMLKRTETISLDFDWIWRKGVPRFWNEVAMPILQSLNRAQKAIFDFFPGNGSESKLPPEIARRIGTNWAVSVPVLTITMMLLLYLVVYFVVPMLT